MKNYNPPTLGRALRETTAHCHPGQPETVPLRQSLGRVAAERVQAVIPLPPFAQAARDGYALRRRDHRGLLKIVGEVPAGCLAPPACGPGQALRIMTGAQVPTFCDMIVPIEEAEENNNLLTISGQVQASHVRRKGCDLPKGSTIFGKGQIITPTHLALAAATGIGELAVYPRPRVAILCTGSELVEPGAPLETGQIFSANLMLLQSLVSENGGEPTAEQTAPDHAELIIRLLREILNSEPNLILTTGGTGPGGYDLIEHVFAELGVEMLINGLAVKPGHHTRIGIKGKSMLCALPGPPPAARLIFNEVVRPMMLKLLGRRPTRPLRARLSESLACKGRKITNLKEGIYSLEKGIVTVRQARRREAGNCVIVLPARTRLLEAEAMVTVHPVR